MVTLNFKKTDKNGKPVLIILHGLFGSLDNWQTLSNRFKEHFLVYLVDQRNHGKSPHTDSHTFQEMAEDIKQLMDEEQIEKAFLMGHSMGGKTVTQFLTMFPEKVEKAISVDMGIKAYPPGHDEILDALQKINPSEFSSRKDADEALGKYISNFGIRQFLLKNLDRKDDGSYVWKMNLEVLTRDYDNILEATECKEEIKIPILFIKGANSNYIRESDLDAIKKCFPKAELKEIAGAGHWVHAEKPDELFDIVVEFLKKGEIA